MVHCLHDSSCLHCWQDHCSCTPEHKLSHADVQRERKEAAMANPPLGQTAPAGSGVLLAQLRESGYFSDNPCCNQENPLWYCLTKVVFIAWELKYTLDHLFHSLKQLLLGYSLTLWVTHLCLLMKRSIMFIYSQFSEALSAPTHRSL